MHESAGCTKCGAPEWRQVGPVYRREFRREYLVYRCSRCGYEYRCPTVDRQQPVPAASQALDEAS